MQANKQSGQSNSAAIKGNSAFEDGNALIEIKALAKDFYLEDDFLDK